MIAKRHLDMLGPHDQIAETRTRRNANHKIVLTRRNFLLLQFLIPLHTGLALRMAAGWIRLNPLEFVLDEFLPRLLRLGLPRKHGLLLL